LLLPSGQLTSYRKERRRGKRREGKKKKGEGREEKNFLNPDEVFKFALRVDIKEEKKKKEEERKEWKPPKTITISRSGRERR